MIESSEHGCILLVRAQPGARRSGIQGEYRGRLKIAVSAPPEDGRANDAIVDVIRESLALKRSQISLLGGQTSRDKRFLITGISLVDLTTRVSEYLKSVS